MEVRGISTFFQSDLQNTSFAAFREMRKRGKFCDLTIKMQDHSLSAHRVIVAAGIPYFRSVFTTKEKFIALTGLDPNAVESLIDFAYTSKILISRENVHSLLVASEFLKLRKVHNACLEFLSTNIHVQNVALVHRIARKLEDVNLFEKSNLCIRKHFEEFSRSRDFLNLPFSYVKELISENDLNVSNEKEVFEAAMRWVRNSPAKRSDLLPGLLSEVRLVYLPKDYLINHVESDELVKNSASCRNLINEVKNYHLFPKENFVLKTRPRKFTGDGHVYAVVNNMSVTSVGEFVHSVHKYDFVNDKWKYLSASGSRDCVYYAATVNEKIYVFHGTRTETFNVKTREWEFLEVKHGRSIHGTAIVSYGSVIYFFGSFEKSEERSVRVFDTQKIQWLKEGQMKVGRSYAAAISLGNVIYVLGGLQNNEPLDSVEVFCPSTNQYRETAPMLIARACHACATMNGKIYVCGGQRLMKPEVYDPMTNRWTFISVNKVRRYSFSMISHNGKIYALGGDDTDTRDMEIYDPESDQWSFGTAVPRGFVRAVWIHSYFASGKRGCKPSVRRLQ